MTKIRLPPLPTPPHGLAPPAHTNAATQRAALAQARTLGVPRDYAHLHGLRHVREPVRLAFAGFDVHGRSQWLQPVAARAWLGMRHAAAADQVELQLVSAFRSVTQQLDILQRKRERGIAIEEILRVNAAPGYSEHHSGRAVDLTTPGFTALEETFERSSAFAWLRLHAARFGFALSFPRDNRHDIAYEPWHWCWRRATQRQRVT